MLNTKKKHHKQTCKNTKKNLNIRKKKITIYIQSVQNN